MMLTTKKKETISSIITSRRNRVLDRKGYVSLVLRVVFLALAGWIMFTWVFLITQVRGNEMFPALKDGDLVIAFRLQREYAKNDVVVYTADGKPHLGRIVARTTDSGRQRI